MISVQYVPLLMHASARLACYESLITVHTKTIVLSALVVGSDCRLGLPPHLDVQNPRPQCSRPLLQRKVLRCNSVTVGARAAGEVLAGADVLYGSYDEEIFEPSHDLRELASAQLRSTFQVLARLSAAAPQQSNTASSCRACVYARRAETLGSTRIRLQRIACWPPRIAQPPAGSWSSSSGPDAGQHQASSTAGGAYEDMDSMDDLCVMDDVFAEASLCQEEMLLLPNSNMVVLPLAEAGVLVGLLVVAVDPSSTSGASNSTAAAAAAADASPWADQQSSSSQMCLSEDALWCLRMAVPPLAKACAMDLRSALAGAQQEAQQRLARSLLLEARGPLKVLGTFGQMLAPRLRAEQAGQPESDMADGMLLQGQRLADVVAQLEAALRPLGAGGRGSATRQQLVLPAADASAAASAALPAMGLACDSFDEADEFIQRDVWRSDTQQQQQQQLLQQRPSQRQQQQLLNAAPQAQHMKGLPAGTSQQAKAGYLPEHSSSSIATDAPATLGVTQQQQQQQQEVPHLPGQGTAGSLGLSSRDIRWSSVHPDAAAQPSSSSSSSSKSCSAFYSAPSGGFDMQKTIDMEPMAGASAFATMDFDSSSSSNDADSSSDSPTLVVAPKWIASGSSSTTSKRANKSSSASKLQQHPAQPQQQGYCNLIDTISHLLTAAANLAKAEGKNFIVNSPLQLDPSAATCAQPSSSSSSDGPVLLPRPIRPLLVGLAASTCRRVLGYVLDVALQCTPRGGQLCLTARESSGGVELSLLHTGQVQASRMHTTSKALAPAVHCDSSSNSRSACTATGSSNRGSSSSSTVAVPAQPVQRSASRSSSGSVRMQELASSSALRSSSSSLVSLDFASAVLQDIGGRLAVVYPCHFMNAVTGNLEVGSSIEVWLPPPAPGAVG